MKKRLDMMLVEARSCTFQRKGKSIYHGRTGLCRRSEEDKAGSMFAETVKVEVRGNTFPM